MPRVELEPAASGCEDESLEIVYGRVGLDDGRESWSDVAVRAPGSSALELCKDMLGGVFPEQLAPRVAILRECGASPLPAIASPNPGMVLIQPTRARVPIVAGAGGKPVRCATRAAVHYTRSPSVARCKEVRDVLIEQNLESRDQATRASKEWLEGELAAAEKAKARACIEAVAVSKRCLPLEVSPDDYDAACSKEGPRCRAIKERAMKHNMCALEEARAKRACQEAIARKRVVAARIASPPAPVPKIEYRCF